MMKFYSLCIAFLFTLLISCTSENVESVVTSLSIDPEKAERVDLNSMIENMKVVKLVTNDSLLIAEVRDIICFQHNIYILDAKTATVYIYNDKGDAINKIANRGSGPGEYTSISCFYIDNNENCLVIVDNNLKKKLIYDLAGVFVQSEQIPFSIKSVDFLSGNQYVMVRNMVDSSNPNGFVINIFENNEIIKQFLPFSYKGGSSIWEKDRPLTMVGDRFFYNSLNNDTIYQYTSDSFYVKYVISFCGKGMPKYIKELPKEQVGDAFYSYLKKNNYESASWLSVLDATTEKLFLSYAYKQSSYFCVYDLHLGQSKHFYGPYLDDISISDISNNYFYNKGVLCFVTDNFKISKLKPSRLDKLKKNYPDVYDKIHKMNISDNPVLVFCDIKKELLK